MKENSETAIDVNKIFKMICRLEKVTGPAQKLSLNDFTKFVCQPSDFTALSSGGISNLKSAFNRQLKSSDIENLWTADDQKKEAKLRAAQRQNRSDIQMLQRKLAAMAASCELQLSLTLKTLQQTGTEESL